MMQGSFAAVWWLIKSEEEGRRCLNSFRILTGLLAFLLVHVAVLEILRNLGCYNYSRPYWMIIDSERGKWLYFGALIVMSMAVIYFWPTTCGRRLARTFCYLLRWFIL